MLELRLLLLLWVQEGLHDANANARLMLFPAPQRAGHLDGEFRLDDDRLRVAFFLELFLLVRSFSPSRRRRRRKKIFESTEGKGDAPWP